MNLLRYAVIALVSVNASIPATRMEAGATVTFPANYKFGVLYNVVDREDQNEVHEQYTSREAVEAAKAGAPLPIGSIITSANYKALLDSHGNPLRDARGGLIAGELSRFNVMEKRAGAGAKYSADLRNGDWQFAAFTSDGTIDAQADTKRCMECHKPHERLDYVKTYFAMSGKRVETNPAPVPLGAVVAMVVRFAVTPPHITVQAGTPVTWINTDDTPHQFLVEGTALETAYLLKGQTGTLVIKTPGVYHYRDTFYPVVASLKGVLEVRN